MKVYWRLSLNKPDFCLICLGAEIAEKLTFNTVASFFETGSLYFRNFILQVLNEIFLDLWKSNYQKKSQQAKIDVYGGWRIRLAIKSWFEVSSDTLHTLNLIKMCRFIRDISLIPKKRFSSTLRPSHNVLWHSSTCVHD